MKEFAPIAFFIFLFVYGLFVHPQLLGGSKLPIEAMVLIAMSFNGFYLLYHGFTWERIQKHIIEKVSESIPVLLIFFAVGALIGSWIISGTIPMLTYYGIDIINPNWIYLVAFLICIVFSVLTGTSFGSAGTIGIVMMGIAQVYGADLAITAAAVIGGAFFGDKLSPLSDSTNAVALSAGVELFDHINSMLYTTIPAAILAAIAYAYLSTGAIASDIDAANALTSVSATQTDLKTLFHFNPFLLLPVVVILWGSFNRKPVFLTLMASAILAVILAFIFQDFNTESIVKSVNSGFSLDMAEGVALESDVLKILNRGGLYSLINALVVSLLFFAYIGTLDVINAIPVTVKRMMNGLKKKTHTVAATLGATIFTDMLTSNLFVATFVISETFRKKYDDMGINRKVLSRSIEDGSTMMESMFPWTVGGIFMSTTLGVAVLDYVPFMFMSLFNITIAFFYAFTGIACFYGKEHKS